MSKDRKQSPHYIPELDPENRKWWQGSGGRVLAWLFYLWIGLLALGSIGVVVGYMFGVDGTILLAGAALIVFSLLALFVSG
ncbi:MAG: hypothetical protein AAFW81_09480 [Pseudomonadota bacterium]